MHTEYHPKHWYAVYCSICNEHKLANTYVGVLAETFVNLMRFCPENNCGLRTRASGMTCGCK